MLRARVIALTLLGTLLAAVLVAPTQAVAAQTPASDDTFFTYSGDKPLRAYEPGAVLKSRTVPYHVAGIPTPVRVVQLLYRSADAQGRPIANATSVVLPPGPKHSTRAVAYQSFYDSLNPADNPSRIFAGDLTFGGLIANVETVFLAPLLAKGYPVIVADTEGPAADFAAGPEYGKVTLDSIRAARRSDDTGLSRHTDIGLLGYSGGAIASNWAAALAPKYAPGVNKKIVGVAEGGLLVAPAHNLKYISGTTGWAGVAAMAVAGVARAYDIDFGKYLSDRGREVMAKMQTASIANVLFQYPGLTWEQLVKPRYADPNSVPEYVRAVNRINLGSRPSPTVPMFVGQGANGILEGSPGNKPGIGPGDGVMIAGDVRTLARQYCTDGTAVKYQQYNALSHVPTALAWAPTAMSWLDDRFAGVQAPSDCGSIPKGNPLTPEKVS
ncbi:lipase family protein [Solicola gregarius]|uniref:Lipase family protein n=1 Tax=Solicola gregarius TaxID=2908642 RepID=A0AA46YMW5_9ACTN|nr:lipase family protein [Solicola gregarius]UYM07019.1 lipase family protein [Solicola gregarius]